MADQAGDDFARRLDVALGARIRRYRKARRISQEQLADAVGVTFQQIQKYERGANRVSFSRLAQIAAALQTPIAELIGGLDGTGEGTGLRLDAIGTPGAIELLEAFAAIEDEGVRRSILALVQDIAVLGPDGVRAPPEEDFEALDLAG